MGPQLEEQEEPVEPQLGQQEELPEPEETAERKQVKEFVPAPQNFVKGFREFCKQFRASGIRQCSTQHQKPKPNLNWTPPPFFEQ